MRHERAETGWLVPAEFNEASSGEVSQEMKFFVYPKKDRPLIWLQAADLLLEAIVKNGDFHDGLKVHMNRDKASKRFLLSVSLRTSAVGLPILRRKTGAV